MLTACAHRWCLKMPKRKNKPSQKWGGGGFTAIPHRVLDSPKFANLSPQATKLLIDLVAQYRGNNNGDLCAAMTLLKPRGWKSSASLAKAIREIVGTGFLVLTKQGGKHKPSLYALSFFAVDECRDKQGFCKFDSDLGIRPTESPRNDWLRDVPALDLQAAKARKKQGDIKSRIIDLKNHLQANPNDRFAENYRKAIEEYERQLN